MAEGNKDQAGSYRQYILSSLPPDYSDTGCLHSNSAYLFDKSSIFKGIVVYVPAQKAGQLEEICKKKGISCLPAH